MLAALIMAALRTDQLVGVPLPDYRLPVAQCDSGHTHAYLIHLRDMQDQHTATLLDYYTRHQPSAQWSGFLTALAEEFETQLDTAQLRILMARIGARFAARYPSGECATLDDLAAFLNAIWSQLDWGVVRLAERDDYLSIEHSCAPLAAFGERGSPWASAFLEGAYQHWLHELGAGSLALQEHQSANSLTIEFRLLKAS
jgi:hypothetical protein